MAARLVSRCASLWREKLVIRPPLARSQSIFTKVREPPNGFLFNEKVKMPDLNGFFRIYNLPFCQLYFWSLNK